VTAAQCDTWMHRTVLYKQVKKMKAGLLHMCCLKELWKALTQDLTVLSHGNMVWPSSNLLPLHLSSRSVQALRALCASLQKKLLDTQLSVVIVALLAWHSLTRDTTLKTTLRPESKFPHPCCPEPPPTRSRLDCDGEQAHRMDDMGPQLSP